MKAGSAMPMCWQWRKGDAVEDMTEMRKHREIKATWQHACRLILQRAPVDAVRRQLSLALLMDVALDLGTNALAPRRQHEAQAPLRVRHRHLQ
jgi:hypothetical protein